MKKYSYKERCRNCELSSEWLVVDSDDMEEKSFREAMYDKLEHPRISRCCHCNEETVKDLIAIFIK